MHLFHKQGSDAMSAPFEPQSLLKPIISFDGMVGTIRRIAGQFNDKRTGDNKQYAMEDFVLSAFSTFYLQCPSFLSYQQAMETDQGNNNARTLFGIEKIPTDNQTRTMLDEESPEILFPMFNGIFDGIKEANLLEDFRGSCGDLLFAFDGVEHHNSDKVFCEQCKTKQHKSGKINYSHGMVTAVLVKPGCPHVIDLPPEFIIPQDGHDKQDCENAAFKRWLKKHAAQYDSYGITVLGDDLYSRQPMCEDVLAAKFHFIFTCKPESHKTLYEFVDGLKKTDLVEVVEFTRWTGKRHETDCYYYINDVPLRDGDDALKVNWCELITTDDAGKILFHNAYATDHRIDKKNVANIVKDGRARWKTENENNNTLKNHGYNLEHNFGHGKNNLCNVLATLNLLAFLCHTVLAMTSEAYQKIRIKLGARKKFFEHIRTLTHYILFPNWDALMKFMMDKLKLKLTPGVSQADANTS
jgi:hypothetical protein